MASVYPGSHDALANPAGSDQLDDADTPHAATHGHANDALEKTQHVIGLSPEGSHATARARMDAFDTAIIAVGVAFDSLWNLVDAKGDLIAGTAYQAVDNAAVGLDGEILVSDTGTATGLAYAEVITEDNNLPVGGISGAVLMKLSNADYDADWVFLSGILPGLDGFVAREPYPTGGTVTTYDADGYSYRVHTFTFVGADESFVVGAVGGGVIGDVLVAGAGGGGRSGDASNRGGGGGAGGLYASQYGLGVGTHRVRVGQKGIANNTGNVTKFDDVWCYGGGVGGAPNAGAGGNGGSGGGGGSTGGVGGTATHGSLDAGVTPDLVAVRAADGATATSASGAGGGVSHTSTITNTSVVYCKGGLGNAGSGAGAAGNTPGTGGQGGGATSQAGGDGTDGIVIIRYRTA
jgi:hypothetical protein